MTILWENQKRNCRSLGCARDDTRGDWGVVKCCVSHSSPKTGLEWGTQRSLPVQEAGAMAAPPRGNSTVEIGRLSPWLKAHAASFAVACFALMNSSRSALIWSAFVVGMPCGNPG